MIIRPTPRSWLRVRHGSAVFALAAIVSRIDAEDGARRAQPTPPEPVCDA